MFEFEDDPQDSAPDAGTPAAPVADAEPEAPVADAAPAQEPPAPEAPAWSPARLADVDWEKEDWLGEIPESHREVLNHAAQGVRRRLAELREAEQKQRNTASEMRALYESLIGTGVDPRIAEAQAARERAEAEMRVWQARAEAEEAANTENFNQFYTQVYVPRIQATPGAEEALRRLYALDNVSNLVVATEVALRGPRAVALAEDLLSKGLAEGAVLATLDKILSVEAGPDPSEAIGGGAPQPVRAQAQAKPPPQRHRNEYMRLISEMDLRG